MVKSEMNCNRAFIDRIMGCHGTSLIKCHFEERVLIPVFRLFLRVVTSKMWIFL